MGGASKNKGWSMKRVYFLVLLMVIGQCVVASDPDNVAFAVLDLGHSLRSVQGQRRGLEAARLAVGAPSCLPECYSSNLDLDASIVPLGYKLSSFQEKAQALRKAVATQSALHPGGRPSSLPLSLVHNFRSLCYEAELFKQYHAAEMSGDGPDVEGERMIDRSFRVGLRPKSYFDEAVLSLLAAVASIHEDFPKDRIPSSLRFRDRCLRETSFYNPKALTPLVFDRE